MKILMFIVKLPVWSLIISVLFCFCYVLYKRYFGRFGKLASPHLELSATVIVDEFIVYILKFRKKALRNAENLAHSFSRVRVKDANEYVMKRLKDKEDLPNKDQVIKAKVGKDRLFCIRVGNTAPHENWIQEYRSLRTNDCFTCIDVDAVPSAAEADIEEANKAQAHFLPGRPLVTQS